jgi:hypothetical protein
MGISRCTQPRQSGFNATTAWTSCQASDGMWHRRRQRGEVVRGDIPDELGDLTLIGNLTTRFGRGFV